MPIPRFQVVNRFREFRSNLTSPQVWSSGTVLSLLLWMVSFVVVFYPVTLPFTAARVVYIVHIFLWFKVVGNLSKKLKIPSEMLLLTIFCLLFFYVSPARSFTALFRVIALLIALICHLFFSLLLVRNSKGKLGVLVTYTLLILLGSIVLRMNSSFILFIFQAMLFVYFLRKTAWLEELTKVECWLYLVGTLFMWREAYHSDITFNAAALRDFGGAFMVSVFPYLLHLLFSAYLLATVVKIPVVLVYNFASLSRKLRISSLFQSTFPQLIQIVMLVTLFYLFIAGWQAEKIRMSIFNQLNEESHDDGGAGRFTVTLPKDGLHGRIRLPGYEAFSLPRDAPELGIVAVTESALPFFTPKQQHFLFLKSEDARSVTVTFATLHESFLKGVAQSGSILAGTLLQAYPSKPSEWESYLYKLNIPRVVLWGIDSSLRILPFGAMPRSNDDMISAEIPQTFRESSRWANLHNLKLGENFQWVLGRVIAPILNARPAGAEYFVFDIVIVPNATFFTAGLVSYVLVLTVIYGLVNILITRRMSKFGLEINRAIVQKFNQLTKGIREISTGNLNYKIKVEGADEFVELADRFNRMGDELKVSIDKARENERLEHELTIARQVQLGLLPRSLPEIAGFKIAATLQTANEVGGDFYDVMAIEKQRYLFTVGDVSGKGTSAAFYMAQCLSLIRYSRQFTDDPHEIMLRLNTYFADPMVDKQIFVTAIIGLLDAEKSSVSYVRGGHSHPIFLPGDTSKKIRELSVKGLGIGLEKGGVLFEENLEKGTADLTSGDTLVLYTDGVPEAARPTATHAPDGVTIMEYYGEGRMMKLLEKVRGGVASAIQDALVEDISTFYGSHSFVDDYTLLIIQRQ